jgi:hypothetical protein
MCMMSVFSFHSGHESGISLFASAGGLLVSEGLYSPVTKYFGTCFKIRIWIQLSGKKQILSIQLKTKDDVPHE